MPLWMSEKLWMPDLIRTEFAKVDGEEEERQAKRNGKKFKWKLLFGDHHESHAASDFILLRLKKQRFSPSTVSANGPPVPSASEKETS